MEQPKSPFSGVAWARYLRLMRGMALVTVLTVNTVLILFYRANGLVSVHFYVAVGIGMTVAMMLMAALMGLVFVSNASGHDASVDKRQDKDT